MNGARVNEWIYITDLSGWRNSHSPSTTAHIRYTIAANCSAELWEGRSPPTEERAGSYPSFIADVTMRLQQLVAGWQGAERNQPLSELHNECLNAAGPGGRHLLPARFLLIEDLDETYLQAALRRPNGKWQGMHLRFHFKITGRFDAALVPIGPAGEPPDRWLLAIEAHLPIIASLRWTPKMAMLTVICWRNCAC